MNTFKPRAWMLLAAASASLSARAADDVTPTEMSRVVINGDRAPDLASGADTASWLSRSAGVSTYSAGGVSGLPVLRGLADDRIKIRIDGAEATAACGNHMNPPLSYLAPQQVSRATVLAGVTPVSLGGDSIAGVIDVQTAQPLFAAPGQEELFIASSMFLQSRSVDHGRDAGASATVAGRQWSVNYAVNYARGDSYQDGDGRKVLDTLFESINQSLTLGLRSADARQRLTLRLGKQHIPYQGFANQYMDMTDNRADKAGLAYEGDFDWGHLRGNVFWQDTRHEMGFFSNERSGTMPMNTHGRDAGYRLQLEWPLADGVLRLGQEYYRYRLNDWWPPVTGSMMMEPDTYWNVREGRRDRTAFYGEWVGPLRAGWSSQFGLRYESVRTDAGTVQSYGCGMMCDSDTEAAASFNAATRKRRDGNVDASLSASRQLDATTSLELGLAHKTRSPNLYERYSWGRGTMAMTMIGWFGDANGYVGNLDLRPEKASTLSAALTWTSEDAAALPWSLKAEPFYTYVQDFIDVDVLGTFKPYDNTAATRALLQFANHDALLWGLNLSGQATLSRSPSWGDWRLKGKLDWTQGRRADGGNLYHIMPANLSLSLTQEHGAWAHEAQWQLVAAKTRVDARRMEAQTGGYALLHLSTRYQIGQASTVQIGLRNLLDRRYDLPLGGANLAAFANGASTLASLPGQGRSIDVGLQLSF